MIKIAPLSKYPEYAPILAYWSYMEWYLTRNVDFNLVAKSYIERSKDELIPCSFIALSGTLPAGMVTLKENDLWSRKDLNPWLASLFVVPEYRNKGAGTMLVSKTIKKAHEFGLEKIYLFTEKNEIRGFENYYLKMGWEYLSDAIDNDGLDINIFYFDLKKI